MSTDLEHDLRAAFDELAATTTISPAPRFGDVSTRPVGDPRRGRGTFLAAAAVVVALVGGLALLLRDRSGEAPALSAAATTAPAAEPAFSLFPDVAGDVHFDDPRAAVDAYLADRVTTSPPGQTVTYTVSQDDPPFDGGEDQVMIAFSLTVTPDDPALCCDSGDGVAHVQRVDGSWFVTSAEIGAMLVHTLAYTDDGTVVGAFSPRIGGTYTVTVDDFGAEGPAEDGIVAEHVPDLADPTNGPTFRLPGFTAPAVAVRIWQSPSAGNLSPAAMFAEFIVPRGTENAANISLDDLATPTSDAPRLDEPVMLSDTWPTPLEAAEAYLATATNSTAELVSTQLLADEPSASIEPNGRLFTAPVGTPAVVTLPNEVWFRFELIGTSGTTEGIVRVIDTGWASGTPAWAVSYAGTRGVVLASASYDDRLVQVDVGTTEHSLFVRWLDRASAELLMTPAGTTFETGLGADAPPTVAVTLWSKPGTPPAFAEVLVTDGGESKPVDFGALLDSLFGPDVQVTVPSFIGLTEGQARTLADDLGLTADVTTTPVPAGDPADGTVVAQGFADGTITVRGTAVTITIAEAG